MAARVNLIIDQGSTFYQEFELHDEIGDDLVVSQANGQPLYTVTAKMRKSYQASNNVAFNTGLSNGMLTLALNAAATSNIVAGRYVYDAKLTGDNTVNKIIQGVVTVNPEASK